MPNVMAWDLAGRCGIAFGRAGEIPRATTVDLGRALSEAERFAKIIRATQHMLDRFRPDVLVYEAPVGGPRTSHFLVGVASCFVGQATILGYQPRSVAIATVRKHFLGQHLTATSLGTTKAKAREQIKARLIARCGALNWPVRNDDEADAFAIWDYACVTYAGAQSAPLGGLFDRGAA
ncbi:hypothetical protein [Rubellimicrobium arenae]|uniref:hypothetical protein n=1 Tax=Rubellimicrobium arenae TaxID=2817372 RepID=UPI001B302C0D|nr:hypothetical protein [Rubellimicrobium arenae]